MLAAMFEVDRDALICDLAETYHIYDYKAFPPHYIAILAVGLRDDSRIKMKMNGAVLPMDELLLCSIFDALNLYLWHGAKGVPKPKSVLQEIMRDHSQDYVGVSTETFEEIRAQVLNGG